MAKSHAFKVWARIESKTRKIRVLAPRVISPAETWEADREWRKQSEREGGREKGKKDWLTDRNDVRRSSEGKLRMIGQKDEQRFCWGTRSGGRWQNLSTAPKKASGEGRFKSKKEKSPKQETRSSEREGKKKKDKNQNLQTDKCISSFLNVTSECLKCFWVT